VCPGPLFGIRRTVAEKIQFSNRTVVEDSDFTIEALKQSMKIIWAPLARVYTTPPSRLSKWYTQRKRWWFGNLQVWKIHKPWAIRNPWLVYNYLGFVGTIPSVSLMALLPIFLFAQGDLLQILTRGLPFMILPIVLLALCLLPFFLREKKLILVLIPYIVLYSMLKILVVCYIYIRYQTRGNMKIQFGSHQINTS
jgi:cellulose synthase/poly-beta-1,6-N-acetylglucosamine synthase-like glycosyltransferase